MNDHDKEKYLKTVSNCFGLHIAKNIHAEPHVIPSVRVSKINERDIHPFVRPIYKALCDQDIQTGYWAEALAIILRCKCIRSQKLNKVYKSVYETLTGKSAGEDLFKLLPDKEQQLWIDEYVESDEVNADPKKTAEHTKFCLKVSLTLTEFCHEFDIIIPDFNATEYYEQLNIHDLYREPGQKTPEKNSLSLREEVRKAYEDLEKTFPFDDFKTIEACKSESQVTYPVDKVTTKPARKIAFQKSPDNNDKKLASTNGISNASKSDNTDVVDDTDVYDQKLECSQTDLKQISEETCSDTISNLKSNRPPPRNPYFKELEHYKPQPKYTSSPVSGHPLSESTSDTICQNKSCGTDTFSKSSRMAMSHNIRLIDFLPDKFDPSKFGSDPESHILGFRDYLSAQLGERNLDEAEITQKQLDMFKFTCVGEARLWYETNKPFDGISDLEENFLKEYAPDLQSSTTAAKALADLEYNPKTKLSTFVNKIMRLNRTLNYSDNVLRDRFMAAIPVDLRRLAKISKPNTFKEAVQAVRSVLEDPSTEKGSVALISNDDVVESIQGISLSIDKMKKDITKMSNDMKTQNQRGRDNWRTQINASRQYFQNSQGYKGNGQINRQQTRPTGGNGQNNSSTGFRRGQFNSYRGRGQQRPRPAIDRSQVRCYYCNKIGHYQRECWHRNGKFGTPTRGNYGQQPMQQQ